MCPLPLRQDLLGPRLRYAWPGALPPPPSQARLQESAGFTWWWWFQAGGERLNWRGAARPPTPTHKAASRLAIKRQKSGTGIILANGHSNGQDPIWRKLSMLFEYCKRTLNELIKRTRRVPHACPSQAGKLIRHALFLTQEALELAHCFGCQLGFPPLKVHMVRVAGKGGAGSCRSGG